MRPRCSLGADLRSLPPRVVAPLLISPEARGRAPARLVRVRVRVRVRVVRVRVVRVRTLEP